MKVDARSTQERAILRGKLYQLLSFLVLAGSVSFQLDFDDAGVEIEAFERHIDEDEGFRWRTFLPFSTFGKVNPDQLALFVQNQRNMFAAGAGWDLRDTAGVTEEPETEQETTVPISKQEALDQQNASTEVAFSALVPKIDAAIVKEYDPSKSEYGFTVSIDLDNEPLRRRVLAEYKAKGWDVEYEGRNYRGEEGFLHFK